MRGNIKRDHYPQHRPFISEAIYSHHKNDDSLHERFGMSFMTGFRSAMDKLCSSESKKSSRTSFKEYFKDILGALSGIGGNFRNYEDLLSSKLDSKFLHGPKTPSYSLDDVIYIHLAIKYLLELTNNLKQDVVLQERFSNRGDLEALFHAKVLLSELEGRLFALLKKAEQLNMKLPIECSKIMHPIETKHTQIKHSVSPESIRTNQRHGNISYGKICLSSRTRHELQCSSDPSGLQKRNFNKGHMTKEESKYVQHRFSKTPFQQHRNRYEKFSQTSKCFYDSCRAKIPPYHNLGETHRNLIKVTKENTFITPAKLNTQSVMSKSQSNQINVNFKEQQNATKNGKYLKTVKKSKSITLNLTSISVHDKPKIENRTNTGRSKRTMAGTDSVSRHHSYSDGFNGRKAKNSNNRMDDNHNDSNKGRPLKDQSKFGQKNYGRKKRSYTESDKIMESSPDQADNLSISEYEVWSDSQHGGGGRRRKYSPRDRRNRRSQQTDSDSADATYHLYRGRSSFSISKSVPRRRSVRRSEPKLERKIYKRKRSRSFSINSSEPRKHQNRKSNRRKRKKWVRVISKSPQSEIDYKYVKPKLNSSSYTTKAKRCSSEYYIENCCCPWEYDRGDFCFPRKLEDNYISVLQPCCETSCTYRRYAPRDYRSFRPVTYPMCELDTCVQGSYLPRSCSYGSQFNQRNMSIDFDRPRKGKFVKKRMSRKKSFCSFDYDMSTGTESIKSTETTSTESETTKIFKSAKTLSSLPSPERVPTKTKRHIKVVRFERKSKQKPETKDIGIDPRFVEAKSKYTATKTITSRTTGTDARSIYEKPRPLMVDKSTDTINRFNKRNKETNTIPDKKKILRDTGTNPLPEPKKRLRSVGTDPITRGLQGERHKITVDEKGKTQSKSKTTAEKTTSYNKMPAREESVYSLNVQRIQEPKTARREAKISELDIGQKQLLLEPKKEQLQNLEKQPIEHLQILRKQELEHLQLLSKQPVQQSYCGCLVSPKVEHLQTREKKRLASMKIYKSQDLENPTSLQSRPQDIKSYTVHTNPMDLHTSYQKIPHSLKTYNEHSNPEYLSTIDKPSSVKFSDERINPEYLSPDNLNKPQIIKTYTVQTNPEYFTTIDKRRPQIIKTSVGQDEIQQEKYTQMTRQRPMKGAESVQTPLKIPSKLNSELSMYFVLEKIHEEVFRKRCKYCKCDKICKCKCCNERKLNTNKLIVCEKKRSNTIRITNKPDFKVQADGEEEIGSDIELELNFNIACSQSTIRMNEDIPVTQVGIAAFDMNENFEL